MLPVLRFSALQRVERLGLAVVVEVTRGMELMDMAASRGSLEEDEGVGVGVGDGVAVALEADGGGEGMTGWRVPIVLVSILGASGSSQQLSRSSASRQQ